MATAQADSLQEQLETCRLIDDESQRLHCYDVIVDANHSLHEAWVTPDERFMSAQLRTRPDEAEYSLDIRGFVELLHHARYDGKKRINVLGWKHTANGYKLQIIYKKPLDLRFDYRAKDNYAILLPLKTGNETLEAAQFIYIIAAINP